jgi:hypothetical protein
LQNSPDGAKKLIKIKSKRKQVKFYAVEIKLSNKTDTTILLRTVSMKIFENPENAKLKIMHDKFFNGDDAKRTSVFLPLQKGK